MFQASDLQTACLEQNCKNGQVNGFNGGVNFDARKVGTEQLEAILEAGRVAPTAKNLQVQHVYVVQSEERLAKLDKVTPCRYGDPTCVVVAFNRKNVFTNPGEKRDSGIENTTIVATHMMLEAINEGVDSCWINFFESVKVCQQVLFFTHSLKDQERQSLKPGVRKYIKQSPGERLSLGLLSF